MNKMIKVSFKEGQVPFDWHCNWKSGVNYWGKIIDNNRVRVYYPGSPNTMIVPLEILFIKK